MPTADTRTRPEFNASLFPLRSCRQAATAGTVNACPIPCACWLSVAATWAPATPARTTGCRSSRLSASSAAGRDSRGDAQQGAGRPRRVQRLRRGARGDDARRGEHQHLSGDPRRLRQRGHRGRLPCVLREAARGHRRGGPGDRRRGAGEEPQAGGRLHPARPPGVDEVHRDRAHARQAAGHAHEPEPAEPRAGLELAPQPDERR